jgi:hypothetical protein
MTEIEKETGMTDAECEYWDDMLPIPKILFILGQTSQNWE